MEIMGLAVIVILLTLGIFFVTKFTVLRQQSAPQKTFQFSQVTTGFVSTLLNTNAGCGGSTTLGKVLSEIPTQDISFIDCGKPLYQYFNETTSYLLNQTLDKWYYAYEFSAIFPKGATINNGPIPKLVIRNRCPEGSQKQATVFPVRSDQGPIQVTMSICY